MTIFSEHITCIHITYSVLQGILGCFQTDYTLWSRWGFRLSDAYSLTGTSGFEPRTYDLGLKHPQLSVDHPVHNMFAGLTYRNVMLDVICKVYGPLGL
jgi:hypothetical protein